MPEAAPHPAAKPGRDRERSLAALAYIMTWLTGLIVFLVSDEEDRFARWHAIQAIGLGLAAALASTLVGLLGATIAFAILLLGSGHAPFAAGVAWAGVFGFLVPLALFLVALWFAYKAYKGEQPRLPLIAGFADDLA